MSSNLLSPIRNHDGIDTPNNASRIWFLLVLIISLILSWRISKGDIVMVSICTFIFSTVLLNLGWLFIVRPSSNKEPIFLSQSLKKTKEEE